MVVGPAEVLGVSGPSASGKTTLLHLVAGLDDLDAGSIRLGGVVLADDATLLRADRRNLVLVGQDDPLDRQHNVAANIALALPSHVRRRRAGAARVAALMDLLELPTALADARPAELSAGERQRVVLARSLVGFGVGARQALVLLDEPLSAVETGTRIRLLTAVLADITSAPIPVLLVSHDPAEIAAVAGRRAALVEGRLVEGVSPG